MKGASAEFALLAACCRWPNDARRAQAIAATAGQEIDWARFERLVIRHRVAGLAADGMARVPRVPQDVRRRLSAAGAGVALTALAMAGESLRLQRLFDAERIPAYIIKGMPLALTAFGNLALKESKDIDLVVPFDHLRAAERVLGNAGYRLHESEAELTDEELALARRFAKHRAYIQTASGLAVELHFRLQHNSALLAGWGDAPPLHEVPFGGGSVRTLAPEAEYAFLCIHGGGHAWERLKWLADLSACVASSPLGIGDLHAGARRVGAGRASAVALSLCHELLGLDVPRDIRAEVRGSLAARGQYWCARSALLEEIEDPHRMEGNILRRRLCRLLLAQGWPYLREELRYVTISETDARALKFAPRWAFLYPLVRIPRALGRITRRRAMR